MICPQCESAVDDSDVICVSCGAKLSANTQNDRESDAKELDVTSSTGTILAMEPISRNESTASENNPATELDLAPVPAEAPSKGTPLEFHSDCPHFRCEWNKGSSIFIADTTSSLSFKLTPLLVESRGATNFKLFLKFPDETSFKKQPLRFARLSAPRDIFVNYKPLGINIGTAQAVDFYFSYQIDSQDYHFDQQITIDVYSQNTSKDKILENLTISIGDIKQEGYGGDPNMAFDVLKNATDNGSSLNDLLDTLKKSDLWTELILFAAIPITGTTDNKQKNAVAVSSPAPKDKYTSLTLFTVNGERLHLLSGEVSMGRSRQSDIIMRRLPPPCDTWDQERMGRENCRISGNHCKIGIDDDQAWVVDTSSNGCYINNERLTSANKHALPPQSEVILSLGAPTTTENSNISLHLRVYKTYFDDINNNSSSLNSLKDLTTKQLKNVVSGIALTRQDDVPESYLIINRWLPLMAIQNDISKEWAIRRKNDSFALVGDGEWHWLSPGAILPVDVGVRSVTQLKQYYLDD